MVSWFFFNLQKSLKSKTAIYSYTPPEGAPHQVPFRLGDKIKITEQIAGWYRGTLTPSSSLFATKKKEIPGRAGSRIDSPLLSKKRRQSSADNLAFTGVSGLKEKEKEGEDGEEQKKIVGIFPKSYISLTRNVDKDPVTKELRGVLREWVSLMQLYFKVFFLI